MLIAINTNFKTIFSDEITLPINKQQMNHLINYTTCLLSRIYTGDFFACDFLIKMDLAKLHLLNGGFDHDNWDLADGSNCLSWFHTNIVIIENFRRESVLR